MDHTSSARPLPNLYVWGHNRLLNNLLAEQIRRISGTEVHAIHQKIMTPVEFLRQGDQHLFFCDCWHEDVIRVCHLFSASRKKSGRELRLVLLNVTDESLLVDIISKVNIDGVFRVEDSLDTIFKGIRGILGGELWLSHSLMSRSLQTVRQTGSLADDPANLLTNREREILRNIAAGYTNQEIADRLFISTNTVKTHVSNIYAKIDAPNRVQAILWASKHLDDF